MSAARVGVVGGGIVGLAVARRLLSQQPEVQVCVLEKEPVLASHQTGRNSGVVHAGIYYTPGSLKAQLCVRGVRLLREFCERKGLAYEPCGKLIVAVDEQERGRLRELLERGRANGVPDLAWLEGAALRDVEPHVQGAAGVHSPRTAIVDFGAVARAMAEDVVALGGEIRTRAEVRALTQRDAEVRATTTAGDLAFDRLITCAGLHADRVARLSGADANPMIIPFRGEYLALRPERAHLVRGLIYPVPDPRYPFLGVHLTRRIDGGVLIGPNAVLATAREGYARRQVNRRDLTEILGWPGFRRLAAQHWRTGLGELLRSASRRRFVAAARRYVPDLHPRDVVGAPAGIRAQAVDASGGLVDDFRITFEGRVANVRNAPSPAATSSLAIAEHIVDQVLATFD